MSMFVPVFIHNQSDFWLLNHKFTVDPPSKEIRINPGVTTLDVKTDLYGPLKEWYQLRGYSKYQFPIRTTGGDPLPGSQFLGDVYFMINGYRVVYSPTAVRITGVLNSDDYESPWISSVADSIVFPATTSSLVTAVAPTPAQVEAFGIPTTTENADAVWAQDVNGQPASALLETAARNKDVLEHAAFQNVVTYDITNGVPGTAYPIGTRFSPSNNLTDAKTIGVNNNLNEVRVIGDFTGGGSDSIDNLILTGDGIGLSTFTFVAGCSTASTKLRDCEITGTMNGEIVVRDGIATNVANFQGVMHQTVINGNLSLAGAQLSYLLSCYSGDPTSVIDFNGTGQSLIVEDHSGALKFVNKSGPESVDVNFVSGNLELDSTVTNGTFTIGGTYEFIDNSTGTTVNRNTNLDAIEFKVDNIQTDIDAIEVTLANMSVVIDNLIKYQRNKSIIDPTAFTLTIYEDDGTTPLTVFDLKDSAGVASVVSIFQRIPR